MPEPLSPHQAAILAQALRDGQLVLFAGAGLSRLAPADDGSARRLPLWAELADRVAVACHEDLGDYGGNALDLFDAIEHGQSRATQEQAVATALDDRGFAPGEAHRVLADLSWASVITTNYDDLLDRALGERPVWDETGYDRLRNPSKPPRLFAIHGTLERPHTLTRGDYRLWSVKHPRALQHLTEALLSRTVLFVGYSMSDPHLDELLARVRQITEDRTVRHYAWMWQLPKGKESLYDRRDKISATSIDREEDWVAAFRQLQAALRARPAASAGTANADPYAYRREQHVKALNHRYGVANLQALYQWGAGYARADVRLADIFVESDLESTRTVLHLRDRDDPAEAYGELGVRVGRRHGPEREEQETVRERAGSVARRESRLVIVGAPGQGKSTLLRHWLLEGVAGWREQPGERPFPVYLRLSEWEDRGGPAAGRLPALAQEAARQAADGETPPAAAIGWRRDQVVCPPAGPSPRVRFRNWFGSTA